MRRLPDDTDRAVRTHEAAELLGIDVRTLRQLSIEGRGPRFFTIGKNQRRYVLRDVLAYRRERMVRTAG